MRDTKKYLDNGVKFVDEKWDNLGVISVFGHAIEENGVVTNFAFTGPEETNVERVLKEIPKDFLDKLLEAAYLDTAERRGANQEEMISNKRKENDDRRDDATKDDFAKPDKPIYAHSELDMRTFFPLFIRSVLKREKVSMKGNTLWEPRSWMKKVVSLSFQKILNLSKAHLSLTRMM